MRSKLNIAELTSLFYFLEVATSVQQWIKRLIALPTGSTASLTVIQKQCQ